MNAPARPGPAHADPTDFAALRAEGLGWLQAASGRTWTDHHLHDPGITLLEALCYALMDVGYRAGFPVADHLAGPDGEIDYPALSLHPPARVLPCRATTGADLRRVLLDAVPGLDDASVLPGGGGVLRLQLKLSQGAAEGAAPRIAAARQAYYAQRNLGEELEPRTVCVADRLCELQGQIDIGGPREAADVLAEVYDRCDRYIACAATSRSLDERLRAGEALERIYDGPALRHGFIDDLPPERDGTQRLFLSDLAAQVLAVPGVEQARLTGLRPAGAAAASASAAWRGDDWALRLAMPGPAAAPAIEVLRRGSPVPVDPQDLARRLEDLRAAGRAERARRQADETARAAALLPRGSYRELQRYHSLQHLLPAVYGVGRHGVPRSAPPQDHARARQLRAYLLLMEQAVAQSLAQLQQLRALYAIDGGSARTLWSQMVGPESLPGVEQLLLAPAQEVEQAVYPAFDAGPSRKRRALDHLLALHGETYTQNSMRQFGGYHAPQELEALLLENKAQLLREIVELNRDRAAGFDPGRPLGADNCSGLQRRVTLLLGFRLRHPRRLTDGLRRAGVSLVAAPGAAHAPFLIAPALARGGVVAGPPAAPLADEALRAEVEALPLARLALTQALFRAGLWRDRYRLLPGGEDDGAPARRLVLGPDEQGRWWQLGLHADAEAARRAAAGLRAWLLQLHRESEGLHVVEHVLLRPLAPGASTHAGLRLPADFHALRLSVLLPAWTLRTAQPAFRALAEETLRLNCPAQLSLQCLWLDVEAMQQFEDCWEPWLAARRALQAAPEDPALAARADAAACRVIECLRLQAQRAGLDADGEGDEPFLQGHA